MEMYLNVCANYSSTAWVMRLPDHLSWAGIREWGMCHILFRQPDAVCILVEVSQLLLSLSVRLMLLNGSTPPAVNWLGKFLGGYHDDNWHPCFAPWQIEVIWRDSTLTSYLRRHSCHGYTNRQILSALSHPSMQFTSQQAGAKHPFQHTYAHAKEFRCQETSTACACIFYTSKSFGLYISKSLQLGVEIH